MKGKKYRPGGALLSALSDRLKQKSKKECEFRFNYRNDDLYRLSLKMILLSRLEPKFYCPRVKV